MSQIMLLSSGEGGFINAGEIIAIGRSNSAPIQRTMKNARKNNRLIDITYGKASFWAIFTSHEYVIVAGKELNLNSMLKPNDNQSLFEVYHENL